ncbi:MAG TPA: hypothetical protein VFL77_05880 [Solirubrobacterales bacterium]|nr:hypothetical protein [Solirubrobacterales bacterium]
MKFRFPAALLAALAAGLLCAAVAGAAMIGIYRNSMSSLAQRSQLVKLSGRSCARAGVGGAMRITIGKATSSCSYRTPVLGRDLEIAATERLLSGTTTALQKKAYLGLELRAGGGAKYALLVFPRQRKAQLIKVTKEATKYLAIAKNSKAVVGVNEANKLRLRAVNITTGPERGQARLFAYVGSQLVGEAKDEGAGDLSGRASAVVVGTIKNGNGIVASVDDVVVRVPSPF